MTFTVNGTTSGSVTCNRQLNISKEENVWMIFRMALSGDFPANLDSLRWSIKTSDGSTVLGSENFKVASSLMKIKIPVNVQGNARLVLDYKSHGTGVFQIMGVEVRRADIGEYDWSDNPPQNKKKAVKAIKVFALVRSDKKGQVNTDTPIQVANVNVARSGQYSWRLYTETIETLNNGQF